MRCVRAAPDGRCAQRVSGGDRPRTWWTQRAALRRHAARAGAEQLLASRFSWDQAPLGWCEPLRELVALLIADWRGLDLAPQRQCGSLSD